MKRLAGLQCIRCKAAVGLEGYVEPCPRCGPGIVAGLTVTYDRSGENVPARAALARGPKSIWRYDHSLPVAAADAISIGEGLTPLVRLDAIGGELGLACLYGKCEGANPTGSFKDRLASVAISAGKVLFDAPVIASSSTGNAGVAAAAYAAKAGLPCIILTTRGISRPMVTQMAAFGATILTVPDKQARWDLLGEGVSKHGWFATSPFFAPPTGSNPFGIEGYKSLAYEIAEDLGWTAPHWVVVPVCYGDALFGMWRGFRELMELGWTDAMPRFAAAEIYGSIGAAMASGEDRVPEMAKPFETGASSISAVQSTYQAVFTLRQSGGVALRIDEGAFVEARDRLARLEGLFVENAAACAIAAAGMLKSAGQIGEHDSVVCLLTADGLKNTFTAEEIAGMTIDVAADFDQAMDRIVQLGGPELRGRGVAEPSP